uniref:Uncharacterized protein n=1 Tax=Avena sativa TaxID=4498 RepID=A0ACD5TDV0_AVESA
MTSSFSSKGKSTFSKFEGKGGGGRSISLAASRAKIAGASSSGGGGTKRASSTATKRGKAAKKVYSLTGQKFDPPEEREPLRIFYESLSKQRPSSEMAEFWLMEHGLLSPERARKAYDRKQKRQQQIKSGTPVKPTTTVSKHKPAAESWKKPSTSQHNADSSLAKAKRKVEYSDDDDDFIANLKRSNSRG